MWMPLTSFSIKRALRWLTTGRMPASSLAPGRALRAAARFASACRERMGWVKKPAIPFSAFSRARRSSTSKLRAFRFSAPNTVMPGRAPPGAARAWMYPASLRELNW